MNEPQAITITYNDGYAAHARTWQPSEPPAAAVLYLHGIQSHGGWFERSGAALAEAGCCVLMPDRRGSGRNEKDRGHAGSARRLLQDVAEGIEWLKDRTSVQRVSLVGISWGGKLALAAAMTRPARIENVALVAPGLFPQVDLRPIDKFSVAVCALLRPKRCFAIPLNEPDRFTDNPEKQRFIRDDPLRLRQATARFFWASHVLDGMIRREAQRRVWPFAITFILAGRERIIENERTRQFARHLRCRSLKVVEHRQASHTLEFEPDPSEYFKDLIAAVVGEPAGGG